jgi:MoxR-like ATPase
MKKNNMKDGEEIPLLAEALKKNVQTVFSGTEDPVHFSVLGLLGGLHVLVEDVPGVGKTTLAAALAKSAGLSFSRIQFTPDMLPGDVLGMNIWNAARNEFSFRKGPVEAQCILADELNRTSPRTQSAFLEAMQEGQVTVDGISRPLPCPFFMIATQNPVNFTGTFPLPEAELDRFGLSFSVGYPAKDEEMAILRMKTVFGTRNPLESLEPVADAERITAAREYIAAVEVDEKIAAYIVEIVRATRQHANIRLGASPRASVFMQTAAQAQAALSGRSFVIPEDVEQVAPFVLSHRILLSSQARLNHIGEAAAVRIVCSGIAKPTGL